MAKIIFSVSYEIIPEKRSEYLALMKKVKKHIIKTSSQDYTVYEDAERPNLMTEVYFLKYEKDVEEVKRLQKNKTESLMGQIGQFILNQDQVAFRTFSEIL